MESSPAQYPEQAASNSTSLPNQLHHQLDGVGPVLFPNHASHAVPLFTSSSVPSIGTSSPPNTLAPPNDSTLNSTPNTSTPINSAPNNFTQHSSPPSRLSQWISNWVTDWWGVELTCWIIAAVSLIAIVITLESHKSKPLPEWPLQITINSLISVFATISQIAMMKPVVECISQLKWLWFVRREKLADFQVFDDASRGPTGSLILLGKIRGLHLVSLGAGISIVSIAFGAFAQQVVTYPLHPYPSGIATVPLAFNLTGSRSTALESIVLEATFNGLASNGSLSWNVAPLCSTGNCTWAQYPSLSICANVVDLSSMILTNACSLEALDAFFQQAGLENPGYPCFNYTLPYKAISLEISDSSAGSVRSYYYGNATLSNVVPLVMDPSGIQTLTMSPLAGFPGSSNSSLISAYLLYQPDIQESINASLPNPFGYGITLDLCIQTYNTTLTNGSLSTSIISSQTFYSNTTELQTSPLGYNTEGETTAALSAGGINFGFTQVALASLTTALTAVFADSCYQYVNETQAADESLDGPLCTEASLWGKFFIESLNSSDPFSVTKRLTQNIATSLTNALRSGAGGNSELIQFQGTAFSSQPYVATNYTWLIFPISLVSLTLVFLLATISKSQRLGSRVWKSSNMAILQGLHRDLHTQLGGLTSISDMDEKGKAVKVMFNMEGGKAEHGLEYRLVESKQEKYWKG